MLRLLLTALAVYAAAALLAHAAADSMLFPAPPPSYGPGQGLLALRTPDGTAVAACWLPADPRPGRPPAPVILYSHGNAEDLGHVLPTLQDMNRRGYSVLSYDYPGYGQSGGRPSEAGACAALRAAWDWLTGEAGVEPGRIVLYGYSVGGGPSVDLAARVRPAGLILEAAFTTAYRVMTGVDLFPGDRFRNIDKLPRVQAPVLVMQGEKDEVIPLSHGLALFAAAPEPKRSLFVPNAGHCDLRPAAGEAYWRVLGEFTGLDRPDPGT